MSSLATHPNRILLPDAPRLGGKPRWLTGREPELSGVRRQMVPPLIVHVDDEVMMRRFTAMILAPLGYRLRGFPDGDTAFEFICENPPDLVITDVMNPGLLNGPNLCLAVRESVELNPVKLLILTACNLIDVETQALKEMGVMWLTKPFRMNDLTNLVAEMIGEGIPCPPGTPSPTEMIGLIDWDADEIYPPYLRA